MGDLWIVLRLELLFIEPHKLLTATGVFSETVVGDTIEPRGKARFSAKTADVFVSAQESLLRQIICKSDICSGELTEQTAHGGLMASDQLTKSVLVIVDKNACDQVCISQLHGRRLR
jgi:hypothetical protein